ncbi:hypothetical protein CBF34_04560 [Vagococcus penaei]|uniref:Uncharacterized protein n=1 Tax=Vagococcus penaei TaxID=633807 RepID=A0A1Q2D4U0_9ENTE|nr:alpha/beta fold hydrolase [Vagococcus penaei]AQP53301.1 hypothetical protein BW732_02985 [Vagococcus penaei]RSU04071.1 hypothetical protein CBF34_04560 [Vagococcus penaei]
MKKYFVIESSDQTIDLNGIIWQADTTKMPRAIFQIVHGMAEYIERYDEFAQFLAMHNFLVIGHDHLGHGDSIDFEAPQYGFFSEKDSSQHLINDTYQMTNYIKKRWPDIPIFILGHSMGSFVVRNYLKLYSDEVAGAVLMGTATYRKELKVAKNLLKGLNTLSPKTVNPAIHKLLFGSFNKKIKKPQSAMAWLSKNEENVTNYDNDSKAGFIFTNNGFFTLADLSIEATKKNWFNPIRRDLPFLIISGEQDPVGNYGKGPRKVALELSDNYFTDVTLRLYSDLRHELLNETEKEDIMYDIYDWCTSRLN